MIKRKKKVKIDEVKQLGKALKENRADLPYYKLKYRNQVSKIDMSYNPEEEKILQNG